MRVSISSWTRRCLRLLPTIPASFPWTPWPISRILSVEAEVEAACRHFLSIGKVSDSADVDAFLDALTRRASTRDDHTSARPSVTV